MLEKKPDAKTFKACIVPLESIDQVIDQAIRIDFENLPKPCWKIPPLFLLPLEDDEEPYKPNRFAAEMILALQYYSGDSNIVYHSPTMNDNVRYENSEDLQKYASRERGYTDRYNAYGWGRYVENFPRSPDSLIRLDNMQEFQWVLELVYGVQSGLEENFKMYQSDLNPVKSSFIGNRGTAWDWADAVVWDESLGVKILDNIADKAVQSLYKDVASMENQLSISDLPEICLVHLNLFYYIESDQGSMSVRGFFDPSTFFLRPSIYSKAVFLVDMMVENIGLNAEQKADLACTYIKDDLTTLMILRALRYRILGNFRNTSSSRFEKFEAAFLMLKPLMQPYVQ